MPAIPIIHSAGSLNIDDVFRTTHIVRPGETIPSESFQRYAGGKGLNQATALARAGVRVRHVGRIGADGVFLKECLKSDGVDVSDIVVANEPTGHAIIQVSDDGENAIVLFGGANRSWALLDIDRLLSKAVPGDVLLLQNEINLTPEIMTAAAEAGLRLAMNPAPMTPEVASYPMELLSWLVVNEIEGAALAATTDKLSLGNTDGDHASPTPRVTVADKAVICELRRRFPETTVLMTLGERGAIRADASGIMHACVPAPAAVLDSTGAGDTFVGYWLAAEICGLPAQHCLTRGTAAAAISVTRRGATAGIPMAAEIDALLATEMNLLFKRLL